MKFEDKLLRLLNKGLKQGEQFSFKEFRITLDDDSDGDYYLVKTNGRFYYVDCINYAESQMMEEN